MKIRVGFVSNSSSTSFVIIGHSGILEIPSSNNERICVSGLYEFGWSGCTRHTNGRIAFAWMQAQYQKRDDWVTMIKQTVKAVTGLELVCLVDPFADYCVSSYSYIDHQSIGESNEIFSSTDELKAFLFDKESYIKMGNDNE
jgi:hypothetical protein